MICGVGGIILSQFPFFFITLHILCLNGLKYRQNFPVSERQLYHLAPGTRNTYFVDFR